MKETNGTEFKNRNEVSGGDDVITEMAAPEPIKRAERSRERFF